MSRENLRKEMKFEAEPIRVEVEIGSRKFYLDEMKESKNKEFKRKLMEIDRIKDPVKKGEQTAMLPTTLLCMCMSEVNDDGTYRLVKQEDLDDFGCGIIEALATRARQINGMEQTVDEKEEEVKNS